MLFVQTFDRLRMSQFPYRKSFVPRRTKAGDGSVLVPAASLAAIGEVTRKMGFQPLPFTRELNPIFEREGAALMGYQNPEGLGFSLRLGADDEREFKQLAAIFQDHLPLE